jgi:phosphoribosylanthranilate isomerase
MTRIKVCGLRRVEDALAAAEAGADMIGFVFAPSRRRIEPDLARDIIGEVRRAHDIRTVGVFVNAAPAEMDRTADLCDLDYVQLSGDESEEVVEQLHHPAIKTIHVEASATSALVAERAGATTAAIVLLDTSVPGLAGGTGEAFDWSVTPVLGRPLLLAGGLNPENVAGAIRQVRPWGVDVSSGVETGGDKDADKIRAFIRAARTVGD